MKKLSRETTIHIAKKMSAETASGIVYSGSFEVNGLSIERDSELHHALKPNILLVKIDVDKFYFKEHFITASEKLDAEFLSESMKERGWVEVDEDTHDLFKYAYKKFEAEVEKRNLKRLIENAEENKRYAESRMEKLNKDLMNDFDLDKYIEMVF